MSNDLLQKVIDTTNLGSDAGTTNTNGHGLLYPDQANRFIDYMWDATILAKSARTIRMRSNTTEIDKVAVGERIMRAATENNPTNYVSGYTNAAATFSKVSLTTTKLRLDWELSSESLEDNLEGADLEDHIARLMATQAGNDVEDALINGDTDSSDGLLQAFDGFRKKALAGGHVVDAAGSTLSSAEFNKALKAMPRKYKQRRNQLRFFAGSNLVQDYLYNLTDVASSPFDIASGVIRGNVAGPDGAPGSVTPFAFGIPVVNVPLMDETRSGTYSGATGNHGEVHLTFPQNFIVGIKRDVTVYREFKPKKDTIEYTLFIRVGCAIENLDAHVVVKNVKVAS
jgi:hypothetical protein